MPPVKLQGFLGERFITIFRISNTGYSVIFRVLVTHILALLIIADAV